jgi:hypothetical protein
MEILLCRFKIDLPARAAVANPASRGFLLFIVA